jgi:hypothetical protein
LLANVDGVIFRKGGDLSTSEAYDLRATKHIQPGDELFLPMERHPKFEFGSPFRLFSDVPLPEDYEFANGIIRDEIERFKSKRSHKQSSENMRDVGECVFDTCHRCG